MARSRHGKALRSAILVLAVAALVAGCGRRGRLEPPPDSNAPPQQANKAGIKKRAPNPPIRAPDTPFLLDPLIK